jgi:hypothetical protein
MSDKRALSDIQLIDRLKLDDETALFIKDTGKCFTLQLIMF